MGDCPPPGPLKWAWRCQRYGVLPEAGGLLDQLAGEVGRMDAAANVYAAVANWRGIFYGSVGVEAVARWQRTCWRDWEITQQWLEMKNADV